MKLPQLQDLAHFDPHRHRHEYEGSKGILVWSGSGIMVSMKIHTNVFDIL